MHACLPYAGLCAKTQAVGLRPRVCYRRGRRTGICMKASVENDHSGHAALHDFCATIPSAGVFMLSGLASLPFGSGTAGLAVAAAGAAMGLTSAWSLKVWRTGGSSSASTLVSAAIASFVAFGSWRCVQYGAAVVPSYILLLLSVATSLFCLYNVMAGGNPPKQAKSA